LVEALQVIPRYQGDGDFSSLHFHSSVGATGDCKHQGVKMAPEKINADAHCCGGPGLFLIP